MKKLLDIFTKEPEIIKDIDHTIPKSISMTFENNLLISTKEKNSYTVTWVESEIKSSKTYFLKKLSEA